MKKIKIIGVFISFILSVLLHFIYEWFPNSIISVMAPVNESIWEHMKLIVSSTLLFSILEYFLYKKKDIPFSNFIPSYGISCIFGVFIYLLFYIPLNDIFGHKAYIAISLLFLILGFIQIISYFIMNYKQINYGKELGILLVIIIYFMFGYFTYQPPKINLFYDYLNKGYGIIKDTSQQAMKRCFRLNQI